MYAWQQDVPIDAQIYAGIRQGLGAPAPAGLIVHLAIEQSDGTMRYIDVWSSREDCDRFTEERLHPVVGRALAEANVHPAGEPPRQELTVVDVWGRGLDEQRA